jgi:hypothetical protein
MTSQCLIFNFQLMIAGNGKDKAARVKSVDLELSEQSDGSIVHFWPKQCSIGFVILTLAIIVSHTKMTTLKNIFQIILISIINT